MRIEVIASHHAAIQRDYFPTAPHPLVLNLVARRLLIEPAELAVFRRNGSWNIENDDIGKARGFGDIRSSAMQRTPQMNGASADGHGAEDRVAGIESVIALDAVRTLLAWNLSVRLNGPAGRTRNKPKTAVFDCRRLQR